MRIGQCVTRPRSYRVDPWNRGREVNPCVLRYLPEPRILFFAIGTGSRFGVVRFEMPGQRPSHAPGRRVNATAQ